jgi:deazaflavin-dependent oxidoreductase (nitroreductase family)
MEIAVATGLALAQLVLLPLAVVLLASAIAGVTFVVGMRRKVPFVLDTVRRAGRTMKPLILRRAGAADSSTAVVEHVGRTSGRPYETPVVATRIDGGYAIALPYGPNTDWLKNVLAAGRATLRHAGGVHELAGPEVVELELVAADFAAREQRLHRRFAVRDALVLRASDTGPERA